ALSLSSLHAAGTHSGGYSAPLHSCPRISRIPFQATSGMARTLYKIKPVKLLFPHLPVGKQLIDVILWAGKKLRKNMIRLICLGILFGMSIPASGKSPGMVELLMNSTFKITSKPDPLGRINFEIGRAH